MDRACYHVTHRCHERRFLLKFAKHRNIYQKKLFEMTRRFKVDVLDYIVTSNHVHLLLTARHGEEISAALQFLHGGIAQKFNILKEREGSFWTNRFFSTRIQSGEHLRRCLFYIDLNMVRAGAVKHPSGWKHCAWQEFHGRRQRYRIVNMPSLLKYLGVGDEAGFRKWYDTTMKEKLDGISHAREAYWSEAAAVGDSDWLKSAAAEIGMKRYKVYDEDGISYIRGRKCL
jgi:putative transposase